MSATLADLRTAVVSRLQAIPQLAGVEILSEDRNDITTMIATALAQGKGLVVVVQTGNERFTQAGNPTPVSTVELFVEVGEIPAINRAPSGSRLPASDASALIIRALHHHVWTPGKTLIVTEKVYDRNDKKKLVTHTPVFSTTIEYSGGSPVPTKG